MRSWKKFPADCSLDLYFSALSRFPKYNEIGSVATLLSFLSVIVVIPSLFGQKKPFTCVLMNHYHVPLGVKGLHDVLSLIGSKAVGLLTIKCAPRNLVLALLEFV